MTGFIALTACTVHPQGELAERKALQAAGREYVQRFEERAPAVLPEHAGAEELVSYALLTNAEVEAAYWRWRSALEQVPQAGTQKTGLELSLETMITNGASALENTTLGIGNDAMNTLQLPSKLGADAAMALREAQAAGRRFDRTRAELRRRVLLAWYDYALDAELVRLEETNVRLLETMARISESRVATGGGSQTELLKTSNEVDMARNEAERLRAKLAQDRAAINALLNREPGAAIDVPTALPEARLAEMSDEELFAKVAANNPELQAMAAEIAGKQDAIRRAKMEYIPDFNVNFSTDLGGVTQSLFGSVVLPYLRYQAIDAGIRQAEANLRESEARQRQTGRDLASRVLSDLVMMRDAQRQAELFEKTLIPRAERIITASQNAYASGNGMLLDLLDSQRAEISLRRMLAELKIEREKQAVDLEEAMGVVIAK